MQYLSFLHQVFHRTGYLLYRNLRVDTVLVQQVDVIGTQSFQGTFHRPTDMVGTAVECSGLFLLDTETEFCPYLHVLSERGDSLAYPLLTDVRPIDFRRIEKRSRLGRMPYG